MPFDDPPSAKAAIACVDGQEFSGNPVKVAFAIILGEQISIEVVAVVMETEGLEGPWTWSLWRWWQRRW